MAGDHPDLNFFSLLETYKGYMAELGYAQRERESLLSPIFPTTFAMSGGPDLAYKFWQGAEDMRGNWFVNQPCIRHWDIDNAGDTKHLSFFNMFVTDSIEGVSREEMFSHNFKFFTEVLKLNPDNFFVTVCAGGPVHGTEFPADDEAKQIWKSLGLKDSQIVEMGGDLVMENYVANTVEPVGGPRTEMFYDMRAKPGPVANTELFMQICDEGTILELCTNVKYNLALKWSHVKSSSPECHFRKMDTAAHAMGFGPQRLLRVIENVADIGSISEFRELQTCLREMYEDRSGRKPFHREAVIVADHIRGLIFLLHDGVHDIHGKKNRSRRYVYRKYWKSFKRAFMALPIADRPETLARLCDHCVDMFGKVFPDFNEQRDFLKSKAIEYYNSLGDESDDKPAKPERVERFV